MLLHNFMKLFTGKPKFVSQSECNSNSLKFCGFPLLLFKPLTFSKYVNLNRERKKAEILINYHNLHFIESAMFTLALANARNSLNYLFLS